MKKLLILIGLLSLVGCKNDKYMYNRTLKLFSERGSCSGVEIKTDSGREYVLTAAHCRELLDSNNQIDALLEDDSVTALTLVREDINADLMLLSPVKGQQGIDIAKELHDREKLLTYTSGKGYKTYKTEGTNIDQVTINVPIYNIADQLDREKCSMPKNHIEIVNMYGLFSLELCELQEDVTVSDAFIAPGSSGGAVVNTSKELVGIVSAGGENYGMFVTLEDIREFLKDF